MTLAILLVAFFSLFVGVQPAAAVSPLAYVTDFLLDRVLVINTSTNAIVGAVPVGIRPSGVATTPDGAFAYVANQGGTVSVIQRATNTVVATVPLGLSPFDVAITPDGAFAYVTVSSSTQSTVVVISTATHAVVKTIDVGSSGVRRVAITPDGAFAYVAVDFQRTVAVISTATNTVVATVPIDSPGGGPTSLAITPDGAFVYVGINGGVGGVVVIATETNSVVATVSVGSVGAVAITPDGAETYVGLESSVAVIATATNTVVATVPLGLLNVDGIAITHPDGAFAYVTQFSGSGFGTVNVISTETHTVVDVFFAGQWPMAVAITPSEPRVFMTRPAAGATVNGTVWTDVWVENVVGTANAFTLTVGGAVVAEGTATNHATLPWDSRSIPDGAITLTATVRDAAGLLGATTRRLVVRNGVSITSPPAGATVGGIVWSDIWVEGAAAGIRTFTLSIGDTTLATVNASGNHVTLPWDSSRVANGFQAIVATVHVAAGRVGTASRGLIVLNGTVPGVFITSPPAGATVNGIVWSDVWVEGAAAGTRTFTLSIAGTTLATASDSGNHVTLPWDSSRVPNGSQAIVVTVRDVAGDIGVGARTVNVQNGLAAVSGTAPPAATAQTR